MPPAYAHPRYTAPLASAIQLALRNVPRLFAAYHNDDTRSTESTGVSHVRVLAKREVEKGTPEFIVFACLIPTLVLLSGLFAGLTLGLMSLDETQLNVLSISGTPQQKIYANKIKPIRKNGHLLLVTLLLANMIVNETLPIIADAVLGGVVSVVVSTVLIVIFAEVIPQSVCTRYGLAVGATMAPFVKFLLYTLGFLAWPVAKLLEVILGPHHGIIYRRGELKELIHIHSDAAAHGGDLKHDTVTIIGATLDLQEKVVQHAMTPIDQVFMLSIDAVLDFETLRKICVTGHSRVPVYEEIDVPYGTAGGKQVRMIKAKKIVGILLVKQCVLLDPSDAVPVRKIPLNKVATVPANEPLLGVLDRFQEGRSHMAIVTRFSHEKAASVKQVVKRSLTQRIKDRVTGDSSSDSSDDEDSEKPKKSRKGHDAADVEANTEKEQTKSRTSFQLGLSGREQSMPADAVLAKSGAEEFLQSFDPTVAPLGLITLEDVLEELIGEEIYDEFDPEGGQQLQAYAPVSAPSANQPSTDLKSILKRNGSAPDLTGVERPHSTSATPPIISKSGSSTPVIRPIGMPTLPVLKNLNLFGTRSRSAPPVPRDKPITNVEDESAQADGVSTPTSGPTSGPVKFAMPLPTTRISEELDVLTGHVQRLEPTTPGIRIDDTDPMDASPANANDTETVATSVTSVEPAAPIPILVAPVSAVPTSVTNLANSRASSPSPSIEAFIMGSKRRQPGSAAGNVSAPGQLKERTPSVGPKGMRFKSSPLTGGDRIGVVAEQVMKEIRGETDSQPQTNASKGTDG